MNRTCRENLLPTETENGPTVAGDHTLSKMAIAISAMSTYCLIMPTGGSMLSALECLSELACPSLATVKTTISNKHRHAICEHNGTTLRLNLYSVHTI